MRWLCFLAIDESCFFVLFRKQYFVLHWWTSCPVISFFVQGNCPMHFIEQMYNLCNSFATESIFGKYIWQSACCCLKHNASSLCSSSLIGRRAHLVITGNISGFSLTMHFHTGFKKNKDLFWNISPNKLGITRNNTSTIYFMRRSLNKWLGRNKPLPIFVRIFQKNDRGSIYGVFTRQRQKKGRIYLKRKISWQWPKKKRLQAKICSAKIFL